MLLPCLFSVVDGKTTIIYRYILADVIATWLQVVIAVVIAMIADVIANCFQFDWLNKLILVIILNLCYATVN